MTKIVQVWEVCAAAETRVESLLDAVLDKLHNQNQRLAQLQEEIRLSQPMASGSVGLELYPCPGCRGCPHPRWVQYKWKPREGGGPDQLLVVNLDAANKEPILQLKRRADGYAKTAALIREAKTILNERSKLIASLRSLEYAAKLHK